MNLQHRRKIDQINHITSSKSVKTYDKVIKELNKKHKKERIARIKHGKRLIKILENKRNTIKSRESYNKLVKELNNYFNRLNEANKLKIRPRKIKRLGLKNIAQRKNISKDDVLKATELNKLTDHELKKIAKLRKIKNTSELSKKDLIYALLRTETNTKENNYLKLLNNKVNTKIKEAINKITILLTKLGNIVTKEESNSIRKELFKLEKQTTFTREQKEEARSYLSDLLVYVNKKQKYCYIDFQDQSYFGIRDIENLFDDFDDSEYYKPMLIASSFDSNYKEYEIRDNKNKDLSLKQYIFKITPQLIDLINEKMNSTKDEQKIQLIIAIVFKHITHPSKNYTF